MCSLSDLSLVGGGGGGGANGDDGGDVDIYDFW